MHWSPPPRAALASALWLLAAAAAAIDAAALDDCAYWYDSTAHGPAFRNVRDYGARGDGVHDDTAAIQAALNANQTGGAGTGLAPSAAIVYLPPGDYLISDTIVLWYWSHLVGSAACPPTLRLADRAPGFDGHAGLKPIVATNLGFNVSLDARAWWVQFKYEGGHANDVFYVHVRDLTVVVGEGNAGAVGVLWQVAQQASIRNVAVDMSRSGAIAFDQGGPDYAQVSPSSYSFGGGGSWEDLTVLGGAVAFRIVASQNSYRNVSSTGASRACVVAEGMQWAQTIVGLACTNSPLALQYNNSSPGSVLLLDSVLGPGLGPTAIVTDGRSALYLQNVVVTGATTCFVVDATLPVPAGGGLVAAWAAGTAYLSGVPAHGAGGFAGPLPLPSSVAAAAAGVPFLCGGALCGGSAEHPATGLAGARPRPSFVGVAFANARADYGAVGDGEVDDTPALRAALASGRPLFLPWGTYRVTDTLTLCNTTLVGEGLAAIALGAGAPGYGGPYPLLKAVLAVAPGCHAWVADVALTTLGARNDGALLLEHAGNAVSGFWDVHMRLNFRVGLKARLGGGFGGGGGVLSNCWWWGADHNLSTLVEMSDGAADCTQDCTVGQELGVEITTPGPLLLVGTNFEHSSVSEYNLTGAGSVVGTVIQTEGSTSSLRLDATSLVTLFGQLFGSSTGVGANHTATATRAAGSCVAALAAGAPAGALDLSYRLLGSMQKNAPLLLLDDAFSVPGDSHAWACAALLRACPAVHTAAVAAGGEGGAGALTA